MGSGMRCAFPFQMPHCRELRGRFTMRSGFSRENSACLERLNEKDRFKSLRLKGDAEPSPVAPSPVTNFSCFSFFPVLSYMHGGTKMGQKEKLIRKLKSNPKDFTFDEAESLLGFLPTIEVTKVKQAGRESCSPVKNINPKYYCINPIPEKNCSNTRSNNSSNNWNRRVSYEQYHGIQRLCRQRRVLRE